MSELRIVATIIAKEECNKDVYASLEKVVDATRTESGNISYILHRNVEKPLVYVMLEHWSSQEAIDSHNASAHFQTFVAEIDGKVESVEISVVEPIY